MAGSVNLGNVAGVVRGANPPLEADGVTVKTYVLWGKLISTSPIAYEVFYFDNTTNSWESIQELMVKIAALETVLGDTGIFPSTTVSASFTSVLATIAKIINDVTASSITTYSSTKIISLLEAANVALVGGASDAFNTLGKIEQLFSTNDLSKVVRVDTAQSFSAAEKATANSNIAAVSIANFGNTDEDLAAYFDNKMNAITPTT